MTDIIVEGKVLGAKTGARITKRWEPKEWRTEYEAMVALSCTGLSNEEVGRRFGYGKQQVSNILNTAAGKKLKEIILARLRQANEETFVERISHLQNTALERVESVLSDDELFVKYPLAIFDRSQKFLSSTGSKGFKSEAPETLGTVNNIDNSKNVIIVAGATRDSLAEAMQKSDEAKELASGFIGAAVTTINRASSKEPKVGGTEVRALNNSRVETPAKAS